MLLRRQDPKTIGASRHNLSASVIGGLVASVIASLIRGRLSFSFWLSALTIYRLIAQLGVGFSEEAIFRGYLLTRFSAQFKRTTAELLTAGMFAVVHIPQRLFKKSTAKELIVDLVMLFAWGWVFNVIKRRTGNITGLALLHAVVNVVEPE
jgi:membrane protease YdiL (CAAX protease family)